jgi:hypothetical protein
LTTKRSDAVLIVAVAAVLVVGLATAWYNQMAQETSLTGARTVDRKVIDRGIREGSLSDHEASHYRVVDEGADGRPSP